MAQNPHIDWTAVRNTVAVETLARAQFGEPNRLKSSTSTLQWETDQGRLLVNRPEQYWKFMDTGVKGKGPIDWLVKVEGLTVYQAAERLSNETFVQTLPSPARSAQAQPYQPIPDNPQLWPSVRTYLIDTRKLPGILVDPWREMDRVRAIMPSSKTSVPYAAFPLLSPQGNEVGTVLRCAGTPEQQRQQLTAGFSLKRNQAGSHPTQGFWSSHDAPRARTLVLVEAPIDAMALYAALVETRRDPRDFVIRASAGQALNPVHWSGNWQHIVTAFDRDAAGERFSQTVRQANPDRDVRRFTPPPGHKDWAEAWAAHCALNKSPARARETAYEIGDD